jgi:probable rRNA maturation factor
MKPRSSTQLLVSVTSTDGRLPVAASKLERLAQFALKAEKVKNAELSFTFLSPRAMAALNKKHLNHTGPTDVITFALEPDPSGVLRADVYICVDVAREQAREHGVGVREEVQRLVVHGVLHACGHDHPVDESRTRSSMWRRQESLLKRFLELSNEAR